MTTKKSATERLRKKYGQITFGRLLKSTRLSLDLTQEEMAKKLGAKSKSFVANYENDRQLPSPSLAADMAKRLGEHEIYWVEVVVRDSLEKLGYKCKIKIEKAG
ncbi:MAG: helix-turn-helix transcriptional regulator [Bdellovibrionales bacterium]|nr:helix-turn-helix transcriptional regulator [Bdellovibrionales bacterium]